MSGAEMLALAERCEAAEGPDRELDALIFASLQRIKGVSLDGIKEEFRHTIKFEGDDRGAVSVYIDNRIFARRHTPCVTQSIDDALDLIPGQYWSINARGNAKVTLHRVIIEKHADGMGFDDHYLTYEATSCAATPALALCAAVLRALAKEKDYA